MGRAAVEGAGAGGTEAHRGVQCAGLGHRSVGSCDGRLLLATGQPGTIGGGTQDTDLNKGFTEGFFFWGGVRFS